MGNLVRDISSSLEKIGSLREENEDEVLPDVANKYVPVRPMSFVERKRRREKMVSYIQRYKETIRGGLTRFCRR